MKKIAMILLLVFVSNPLFADEKNKSLYQLKVDLIDQNGQKTGLDAFRGRPVLVSMFYASCPYACPLLVKALKKIETGLDADQKKELRVLLVSFDPQRDTVEALKDASARLHVDEARWKLARAPENEARQLANLLRIKYKKTGEMDYDHSSILTLLNSDGEVVYSGEGLDAAAVGAMQERVRSMMRVMPKEGGAR